MPKKTNSSRRSKSKVHNIENYKDISMATKKLIAKKKTQKPVSSSTSPRWIPPPGKTSKNRNQLLAELDIYISRCAENSNYVESWNASSRSKDSVYEQKIDTLLSEIDELKLAADLEKTRRRLRETNSELTLSRDLIEDREKLLTTTKANLRQSNESNHSLQTAVELLSDKNDETRLDCELLHNERSVLMKKLVEIEMEGAEASLQINAIRETLSRLNEDQKRITNAELTLLNKQKNILFEKLFTYDTTNQSLRRLLREYQDKEVSIDRLMVERDEYLAQYRTSQVEMQKLHTELVETRSKFAKFEAKYNDEKNQFEYFQNINKGLEQTRAHLQNQLRQKEADCNRMAVQIRDLILTNERSEKTFDHVMEERCVEFQHQLQELKKELQLKETSANDNSDVIEALKSKLVKSSKEKSRLEAENLALLKKLSECEVVAEEIDANMRSNQGTYARQLHEKIAELAQVRMELEKTKISHLNFDNKMSVFKAECDSLKDTVTEMDKVLIDYKDQLSSCRKERTDLEIKLQHQEKLLSRYHKDWAIDNEKAEVSQKELTKLQGDNNSLRDENENFRHRVTEVERCLSEKDEENDTLKTRLNDLEEQLHKFEVQLENKDKEVLLLSRKLELTSEENKRVDESFRAKDASRERSALSRIAELESQLSRVKSELVLSQRSKDDVDVHTNLRMKELREQLEKSKNTNKSLMNYLTFLKSSYSSVFSDTVFSHELTSPYL